MSIKMRIWWDEGSQAYMLSLGLDRRIKPFVDLLKRAIPSGERDFDPETKFWYFKEPYVEGVRALAHTMYGVSEVSFTSRQVVEQTRQARPATTLPSTPIKTAFLDFVRLVNEDGTQVLSYEAAKRAYRRTASQLHPDKGGDATKMSQLNDLWSRIEHEYYNK